MQYSVWARERKKQLHARAFKSFDISATARPCRPTARNEISNLPAERAFVKSIALRGKICGPRSKQLLNLDEENQNLTRNIETNTRSEAFLLENQLLLRVKRSVSDKRALFVRWMISCCFPFVYRIGL